MLTPTPPAKKDERVVAQLDKQKEELMQIRTELEILEKAPVNVFLALPVTPI